MTDKKTIKRVTGLPRHPKHDEMSGMMKDWYYHVPFEGTLFPVRSDPDIEADETKQSSLNEITGREGMTKTTGVGLFSAVNSIIDDLLGIPDDVKHYGHPPRCMRKAAANFLNQAKQASGLPLLVTTIYNQMLQNWCNRNVKAVPTKKLWVPRTRKDWSYEFGSAEVPLERSAVELFKFYSVLSHRIDEQPNPDLMWFNQIPTATGVVSSREIKNAVDLVCRTAKGCYDFVELKFPRKGGVSETPLFAALEILKSGIAYLFARSHLAELRNVGYEPTIDKTDAEQLKASALEILEAEHINLCVLAPRYFYDGLEFAWLDAELNAGLEQFLNRNREQLSGLRAMSFRFEYLCDQPFEVTKGIGSSERSGFKLDFTRHLVPATWADMKNSDLEAGQSSS